MNIAATLSVYAGGPGSGCRGSNCGRKLLYHGTDTSKVASILKSGLNKGMIPLGGRKPIVYLTSESKEAHYFASRTDLKHKATKPYAIVVVDSAKTNLKSTSENYFHDNREKGTYYEGTKVPPESIVRVEIYDENHNLVKTIKPQLVKS